MRGDGLSRTVRRIPIRPHMRFDLSLQTMMSSQVRPPNSHFHHWGGSRTDPSFHDVIDPKPALPGSRKLVFPRSRELKDWWSQTGSNRRPHACKARALPTELWPLSRKSNGRPVRTVIRSIRPRCLTQCVVGPGRLELPTSRLSGVCSNQLSYRPLKRFAPARPPGPAGNAIAPQPLGCSVFGKRNEDGGALLPV